MCVFYYMLRLCANVPFYVCELLLLIVEECVCQRNWNSDSVTLVLALDSSRYAYTMLKYIRTRSTRIIVAHVVFIYCEA
jgi:hypothetical protein